MDTVCRCCLTKQPPFKLIDEDFRNNYFLLTSLQIKAMDTLPQHSCYKCSKTIINFVQFRDQCLVAENFLLNNLVENKVVIKLENDDSNHSVPIDIKEEFEYTFEDINETNTKIEEEIESDDDQPLIQVKTQNKTKLRTPKIKNKVISKPKRRAVGKAKKIKEKKENIKTEIKTKCFKLDKRCLGCGICKKTFSVDQEAELNQHFEKHKTNFECEICLESCPQWPQLFSHRLVHLSRSNSKCHICKTKITGVYNLEYHYRKEHNDGLEPYFTCQFCAKKIDSPEQMRQHISRHRTPTATCLVCNKVVKNNYSLKNHMLTHQDARNYQCNICGYASKSNQALLNHINVTHLKLGCFKCDKVFRTAEKKAAHVCEKKTNVCPICGKVYRVRSSHMLTHDVNFFKYKCKLCPKAFKSRENFRGHQDRHKGIPRYECDVCNRKFYQLPPLIKHRRVHTGEKPYVCVICKKGFTSNHNLKVHMKVHGMDLVVKRVKPDVKKEKK